MVKRKTLEATNMKTDQLNQLTILKIPQIEKIRWRDKESERIKTTRWHRKYTKVAQWHYFWEVECRGFGLNHIPLEAEPIYDIAHLFKQIPIPELKCKVPESVAMKLKSWPK